MSLRYIASLVLLLALVFSPAQAHLMAARHGTLNLVGDGAYLVLSLPVAAFGATDMNRDGSLSLPELRAGWADLSERIQQTVQLLDAGEVRPLQGLLLTPTAESDLLGAPNTQLLVMGRFALSGPARDASLKFQLLAFEPGKATDRVQLSVTRGAETSLLWFSPNAPLHVLFPSRAQVLAESFGQGLQHILHGWDHLVFVLVLLLALPVWRPALLLLSSFTLGHAVTLLAGGLGWVEVSASLVEPAILATIGGMASLEAYLHWRRRPLALRSRMALVFACALIHGLGFSQAVRELGLQGERLWPTLLGFNLGIEAGQFLVALPCLALLLIAQRYLAGPARGAIDLSRD